MVSPVATLYLHELMSHTVTVDFIDERVSENTVIAIDISVRSVSEPDIILLWQPPSSIGIQIDVKEQASQT